MSSDEDVNQLLAAFKKSDTIKSGANARTSATSPHQSTPKHSPVQRLPPKKRASVSSKNFLSESNLAEDVVRAQPSPKVRRLLYIRPKPLKNKDEYIYHEPKDEVETIVREFAKRDTISYEVRLIGGETRKVSETTTTQQVRKGVKNQDATTASYIGAFPEL